MLFAFRYARPSFWEEHRLKEDCDVLRSEARTNGWMLLTAPSDEFSGGGTDAELSRFAEAVVSKARFDCAGLDLP